jgi:hypothetical protein
LPSDVLRRSYTEFCIDQACAIAGEAREARRIEQPPETQAAPPRWKNGLLIGTIPVIRDE